MVFWNFYFLAKAFLHFRGYLHAGFLWNFLLLLAVAIPITRRVPRAGLIKKLRMAAAIPLGLMLFWSETWLPAPATIWHFFSDPASRPSAAYAWQFTIQNFSPWMVAGVAAAFFVSLAASKRQIRLTPLTFLLVAAMGITGPRHTSGEIDEFYKSESLREVRLNEPGTRKPDFDLIIIHVCSLSWDDLAHSEFDARPFFSRFNYLFTNFNSATAYSTPAAMRLLRAPCGQRSNSAIFKEAPENCYLMQDLRVRGYKTYSLLNHDGIYGGFMSSIMKNAKGDPMFTLHLEPEKLDFDDSPIFSDLETLNEWLQTAESSKMPAAVYYHTISMHTGGHYSRSVVKNPWAKPRQVRYNDFLGIFIGELERFFAKLETSGRKAVVIFVPEHGAALAGTRLQAADLRDIPFPQITLVPVGIRIFGPGYNGVPVRQKTIDKPVSYLALAGAMAALLNHSPYQNPGVSQKAVLGSIQETRPVSENATAIVMKSGRGYIYKPRYSGWINLPPDINPQFTGDRYMFEGPEKN